ncbi:MAG: elongation factor G [Chloroflexi bacterium]|nr:elongation factor G [Chloroflexota bacterium]
MAREIRNIILLSHSGAGKTSLAEALLFKAGAIPRLGRVTEGSTTSDFEAEEVRRHISLSLSVLTFEWDDIRINLLDAPGYADFVGEVKAGLRAADAALLLVCAASGVEVGTEQVWGYLEEAGLPRIVVINKMDRENADFARTLEQVRERLSPQCHPINLPIGSQASLRAVVDLLSGQVPGGKGETPAEMADQIASSREKLLDAIAERDDALLAKYLEGSLTDEEMGTGLRAATLSGGIVPVLATSGLKEVGIESLLEAIKLYLPSPVKREPTLAKALGSGEEVPLRADPAGPLAVQAFKTSADPYVGRLTYLRVRSGTLSSDSMVQNASKGRTERVGQLYHMKGKAQEAVPELAAGDIGTVAKLAETATGETLCGRDRPLALEPIIFPAPIFSLAIQPKTKADLDKMMTALNRLCDEDHTLKVRKDTDTAETILWGMGEAHLDVAVEKMKRKFGAEVITSLPKVPYKETISVSTQVEYKHKKQTGGHGQYGHVLLELEPLPRGSGINFTERIVGGAVPRNYIPAVEKGVMEAVQEGGLAGYPIVDLRATLYDGSFHPVDSSDMAFKIAASHALRKGMGQAQPVLLEPIVNLKVTVPNSCTGDVIGDLNGKRARVLGMMPQGSYSVIEAQAPQAELLRYATDLRSITQGRGIYTVEFSHYEAVPAHVAQRIMAEAQKASEKA